VTSHIDIGFDLRIEGQQSVRRHQLPPHVVIRASCRATYTCIVVYRNYGRQASNATGRVWLWPFCELAHVVEAVVQWEQSACRVSLESTVMEQHGNRSTYNIETVLRKNIVDSEYWRNTCAKLQTWEEVVDQIFYDVIHVEPWMSGNARGASSAFGLLYRLCQLQPSEEQVDALLTHEDSPYIRAVGRLGLVSFSLCCRREYDDLFSCHIILFCRLGSCI